MSKSQRQKKKNKVATKKFVYIYKTLWKPTKSPNKIPNYANDVCGCIANRLFENDVEMQYFLLIKGLQSIDRISEYSWLWPMSILCIYIECYFPVAREITQMCKSEWVFFHSMQIDQCLWVGCYELISIEQKTVILFTAKRVIQVNRNHIVLLLFFFIIIIRCFVVFVDHINCIHNSHFYHTYTPTYIHIL